MWLLDKMLSRLVRKGRLVVTDHDGREYAYGPGGDGDAIRIRFTDKGAAFHIGRYPQMGAGEAYMDGRLVVEPPHDIRDLLLFLGHNGEENHEAHYRPRGPLRKLAFHLASKVDSYNNARAARANAEHTYNLTRRLYELFLDEDRQYTMAYYRDPAMGLEQAQLDKKAHIAAKLHLKPGMKVLDIGCGWGGLALYLHRHYDVDVLGVELAPDQIEFANLLASELGVSERVRFKLMD
jgi:cyclopropane-fatty-acyl-phospholipid synthase